MPKFSSIRISLVVLLLLGLSERGLAQPVTVPFTSGPIPLCDTSTFTANVSGMGYLDPWGSLWSSTLVGLTINITSDHPQTLEILLTSPQGTTLLLSAFNGAGGQNYTNTTFSSGPSIASGSAPFTGNWTPQGGTLSVFDGEYADGTWTITVIDTACTGGNGGGGAWTPGWFDGSGGGGGFTIVFNAPPPCWGGIPSSQAYICAGGTVDILSYYLSNNPNYNYNIMLNWAPVANPNAATDAGFYQIDAIDPWDGCWYQGTFQIIVNNPVPLGADQLIDQCSSAGPVDLTALYPLNGAVPLWSLDGSAITTAAAAAASLSGNYQLIASNGGGCDDTVMVTLNIAPSPSLGADASVDVCDGAITDLTAQYNTIGLTPEWYFNGALMADPTTATSAGTYTLIASAANGCTDQADVTLVTTAPPTLGADQTQELCSNASLDLAALYNTTGLTAAWTLTGAAVAYPSAITAAGTYQLVASNIAACADTALVTVNVNPSPSLGADASASACNGDVIDLTSFYSTTGLTSVWTLSGAAVADPTMVSASGVYMLTAADGAGCSDAANVSVVVSTNPVLGADQTVTECDGAVVDLTSLYATGANATAWTESGNAVIDPTAVTTAGTYTLTVTNAANCSATADAALSFNPSPSLGTDQITSICAGSTVDLTASFTTAGLSTAWTVGGTAVIDATAVDATGDYQLVATNGSSCTDTAMVFLTANANPSLGADLIYTLCPWQTVDLSAAFPVSGMTASCTLNGATVSNPTAVTDTGTYVVSVIDANGCIDEATASIASMECLCVADFLFEGKCIQEPVHFTLLADSVVVGARWDFGGAANNSSDTDPVVEFTSDKEVVVTLEAMLTCGLVTVQQKIHIPDCSDSCKVWIPSAFTPDGDTKNEAWAWSGECVPEDFSMQVFNRWGEVVFASTDPARTWDGTYGGALSPAGIYAYRAGYRLPYQKHKEVRGSITLVR